MREHRQRLRHVHGAGHFDAFPLDKRGQPAEQVNRGDHGAANAVSQLEWLQMRRASEAPQPDVRRGQLAESLADGIYRMVAEKVEE